MDEMSIFAPGTDSIKETAAEHVFYETIGTTMVRHPIRVYPFMLTGDNVSSEKLYAERVLNHLEEQGVTVVDSRKAADVIHAFEINLFVTKALRPRRLFELWTSLRSSTPVVVSWDDLYFSGQPELTVNPELYELNHAVQKRILGRTDAVIAFSESVRNSMQGDVDDDKIHVVHHGVDDEYRVASADHDGYVLHVSMASKRKNPDAVIRAARRLDERVVIAGTDWEERLPDDLRSDGVDAVGYVSESELIDLYRRAGVFYFPTRHEGFGLPLLEAMAAGTPVVSTDVYSVPEVVGDAGILLPPDDVSGHVDAMRGLLTDRDRWRRYHDRAVERSKHFSWETTAEQTRLVYESIV